MACITYNNKTYTLDEFANLLLNGELEKLQLQKKVNSQLTEKGKAIKEAIKNVNELFDRKSKIEKKKYESLLNGSQDLIKLRTFLKKDILKNSKLSDQETLTQAGLSGTTSVNELKNKLATINNGYKALTSRLEREKQIALSVAMETPIKAKNKFDLKQILRRLFSLKKSTNGIKQDEAVAEIMDRIVKTIAKRRSENSEKPITAEQVYNSLFFKKSTPQEIINSLYQLIGKKGLNNITVNPDEIFLDFNGEPRYYLSDKEAQFKFPELTQDALEKLYKKIENGTPLKEILFHEKLFRAYPQLSELTVKAYDKNIIGKSFSKNTTITGAYTPHDYIFNPKKDFISLNVYDENGNYNKDLFGVFRTLIHEIQHSIQHIENFNLGANPQEFIEVIKADKLATSILKDAIIKSESENKPIEEFIPSDKLDLLEGSSFIVDLPAIADKQLVTTIENHSKLLDSLTKKDAYKMYKNLQSEVEAFTAEKVLELDDKINYYNQMLIESENEGFTKPFKNDSDAFFTVLDKKSSILFQDANAAYQSSGTYSIGNAKFDVLKEGEDIIHAITNPNVSSPLHEMAHKYEKYLTPEERQQVLDWTNIKSLNFNDNVEKAEIQQNDGNEITYLKIFDNSRKLIGDTSIVAIRLNDPSIDINDHITYAKVLIDNYNKKLWTTETSEKFARGFEKYLADGNAPTSALKEIFEAFKTWLTEIYNGIIGSDIDLELNDEMKSIYSKMLGETYVKEKKSESPVEETPITEEPIIEEDNIEVNPVLAENAKVIDATHIVDDKFSPMQLSVNLRKEYSNRITEEPEEQILNDLFSRGNVIAEPATDTSFIYYTFEENENPQFKNFIGLVGKDYVITELKRDKEFITKQEDLVDEVEEEQTQPTVIVETPEEFTEKEKKPITEVNGYQIGDPVTINGNPYRIKSFMKLGDGFFVTAASLIIKPTTPQSSFGQESTNRTTFPISSVKEFKRPIFKNSAITPTTTVERDYTTNPPQQGDTVLFKGKQFKVNTLKDNGAVILKRNPGYRILNDEVGIYIIDENDNYHNDEPYDSIKEATEELEKLNKKAIYEFAELKDLKEPEKPKEEIEFNKRVAEKSKVLTRVLDRMKGILPAINYEIVDMPDQSWKGKFQNNKVIINLTAATLDTPVHEFLHPFFFVLSKENNELYNNLIKEMKSEYADFYKENKKEISTLKDYSDLTDEQIDEEILVRLGSKLITDVTDESGFLNNDKLAEAASKHSDFFRNLREMILSFLDSILSVFNSKSARTLDNIKSIEYNPKTGVLKVFGSKSTPWVQSNIGTTNFDLKDFAIKSLDSINSNDKLEIKEFIDNIEEELKSIKTGEDIVSLDLSSIIKEKDKPIENELPSSALNIFPVTTSIEELSIFLTRGTGYQLNIDNHLEAMSKLGVKYQINNKEDYFNFTNDFRNKLINFQNTLDKRLKTTEFSSRLKSITVGNIAQLKDLTNKDLVNDENLLENSLTTVRMGFTSLVSAEKLMQELRTKINYGDIDNYINALLKELKVNNVTVVNKLDNFHGIRIKKNSVEINTDAIKANGFVPLDISKFTAGKVDEEFRKKVQAINSKVIASLKPNLTPAEIEELNWNIAILRNYYAVFDRFNRSLLNDYIEHIDYATEYDFYTKALTDSILRVKELERNMKILAVEWLYPSFDKLQIEALSKLSEEDRKAKYISKEQFGKLINRADKDLNSLDYLFGTIVNSHDPINATLSIIISDAINNNTNSLGHLVSMVKSLRESYFTSKGINTTKERENYIKENFLRKISIYDIKRNAYGQIEKQNGEPVFELVEKWAYHTEYDLHLYEQARKEFIETKRKPELPRDASKDEWLNYKDELREYFESIKAWEDENLEKFKNKEFERLNEDPMFKFLYDNYKTHNDLYGENKLKYGIVQQGLKEGSLIDKTKKQIETLNDKKDRLTDTNNSVIKKIGGAIKSALNYLISNEKQLVSEQQNPDGTIYKQIKTSYLRTLSEENLDLDLTNTIAGFAEDALRYNSLRTIQANVENLRLLVNGHKDIDGRKVPQMDANGQLIWHSLLKSPKTKNQLENRLNKQLNYFIDRVFYGEKQKDVGFTLWESRGYKENLTLLKQMIAEGKTPEEIYKATSFYLDDSNNWKTDVHSNVNINLNKIVNGFTFYTSASSLAFNIMSTARNLSIGNFVNLSEGHGGKYYTKKNYAEAQFIYGKNIWRNAMDMASDKRSKLNQVLFDYQAIQGEFRDRYNKLTTEKDKIAKLFSTDTLFAMQHIAEHQIQGTSTLALMLNTKVKLKDGTETNLWDALELDKNGVLTKEKINLSSFDETKFIRDLHEMNRSNHGNYSDLHKTVIQREWYGSLLMTFRKHLYPTLKARWGRTNIDYSKGQVTDGFHRVFFRKIANDLRTYGHQIQKYESLSKDKNWTEDEKYAFQRSTFETFLGVIGMMILTLLLSGGGSDDDDDSTTKKWLMAISNGLYTDIAVTNPLGTFNPFTLQSEQAQDVKRLLKNPTAVQYSIVKMADFLDAIVEGKSEEVISSKGEKLVPIIKHIEAFSNPDEYVDGYLKYQTLIGTGSKK